MILVQTVRQGGFSAPLLSEEGRCWRWTGAKWEPTDNSKGLCWFADLGGVRGSSLDHLLKEAPQIEGILLVLHHIGALDLPTGFTSFLLTEGPLPRYVGSPWWEHLDTI